MPSREPQPKPKRVVVAINPNASFGSTRAIGPALVRTLRASGHEVQSITEPDYEQAVATAREAVRRRPDALIVVGGDGMVNLGAGLVAGTKVPLGLVPSGTGNDMARALGIPHDDTEAAIRHLLGALQRPPRVIDAARASWSHADTRETGERWFACAMSAGFDAIVNERANRMEHPKGASRYIIALLVELARLRPIRYRLTLDGREIETEASLVSLGNGQSLGGGMRITPDARLDDGLLDVMIVEPLSRGRFLRLFPRVFKGTHVSHPAVRIERARRVRIEADGVAAYGDGERFAPLPVDVELVPGALRVLA
ncbi:diacylglycerol/lipid kinase family protein [Homoserinibacter sp. YIM 151385]|uniref:diacylglycerol/lipid kinase family protein n=1 Tax=Homoserinibacter sp. YIM 151385 TaxID=2985506 RepID=UPI0022F00B8E|nr:diacylglycerol kinase family protein [Homoserinibacter sp. YIM 151385]WBU39244.1 diacylglycerol kinase family protein [Homoserinibacter sp. YIM 151385]